MIKAFTGLTGSGKTLSMVMAACRHYKDMERPIFSNFRMGVWDYEGEGIFKHKKMVNGKPAIKWATVLRSDDFIEKLLSTKTGLFLVDEAGFVFNNRKWRTLPFELVARFQQSRKLGVDIYYTSQNISRVDMTLRELTHVQIMCQMDTMPFASSHWRLLNEAYYNPIIGHDSESNRKLYEAYREWWFWWQFKKYYSLYDTLELINFSIGKDKKDGEKTQKKKDQEIIPDEIVIDMPPSLKKNNLPLQNFDNVVETADDTGIYKIYRMGKKVVHVQNQMES